MNMTSTKDLMNKPLIFISAGSRLTEALELMKEKRIRHLPVVENERKIIGILSSKDIPKFEAYKDLNVEVCMNASVTYIDEMTPLKSAVYKILENKISCLLVTRHNRDVVGILTTDDLLWYMVSHLEKDSKSDSGFLSKLLDLPSLGQVAERISQAGI